MGSGKPTLIRIQRITSIVVAAWFVTYAAFQVYLHIVFPVTNLTLFGDARVYRLASLAWIQGRDPWGELGLYPFAAPPPTLVFMAPFALVQEAIAIPLFVALSVASIAFAVHRLRLPIWWVLWPPLVDAVVVGNPDAVLVALLLTSFAPIAVFAKIYGVIPVAVAGRWRQLAVIVILLMASAPLLPWDRYLAHWTDLRRLQESAGQNLSAWGTPLLVPTLLALIAIGPRRAGWLIVPTLWPNTQTHYNVLGMPVARNPLLALGLSIPIPLVAPVSVIVFALGVLVMKVRRESRLPSLRGLWDEDG